MPLVNHVLGKKNIELFLRSFFFKKTDVTGWVFIFIYIQQNTDAGTYFYQTQNIFQKLCLDAYFIGYYSSQVIKLDSESLCKLSTFVFITDA